MRATSITDAPSAANTRAASAPTPNRPRRPGPPFRTGDHVPLEPGKTHMHEGQQGTRPDKQANPQAAPQRLIPANHCNEQPDGSANDADKKSQYNSGHGKVLRAAVSTTPETTLQKEIQLTKDGGARLDRTGVGTPAEKAEIGKTRGPDEVEENPAEEGKTAQGIEATGTRGTACRAEARVGDCAVATAGPSKDADEGWTTGAAKRISRTASSNPRRCPRLGSRCCPKCPIRPRYLSRRRTSPASPRRRCGCPRLPAGTTAGRRWSSPPSRTGFRRCPPRKTSTARRSASSSRASSGRRS